MLARPAELAALARTVHAEVEGSHLPVALIFLAYRHSRQLLGRPSLPSDAGGWRHGFLATLMPERPNWRSSSQRPVSA